MFNIAVCDDEQNCLEEVVTLIKEYREEHPGLDANFLYFNTTSRLLDARKKMCFNAYILDIYIDVKSGVDIAGELREAGDEAKIIFLTTSAVHYRDAFRVHAARYLEKPVDKKEFFEALDTIFLDTSEKYFAVKDSGELIKVKTADILYVTSEDHYKSIRTDSKSYLVRGTMQEIVDGLDDESFYPLNNKVIINLKRVKKINSAEIEMEDGKEFPVPRGSYKTISSLFLKYSFE